MISNPSIPKHSFIVSLALAFCWLIPSASAENYSEKIRSLLDQFCLDCHEGERTALDNSMLMLCSSMLTGHHDATQLPVVMLGGGGGRIKGGQNLNYLGKANRQMSRLFLSTMEKMDVHPKTFGDATKPLEEV